MIDPAPRPRPAPTGGPRLTLLELTAGDQPTPAALAALDDALRYNEARLTAMDRRVTWLEDLAASWARTQGDPP